MAAFVASKLLHQDSTTPVLVVLHFIHIAGVCEVKEDLMILTP
jgi:hypothetical protein